MPTQIAPEEQRVRVSLLLDAYGALLPEKQRGFMRRHFEEDLSFGEIAAECGLTRQAVHDAVRHATAALEEFEKALRLVKDGWSELMRAGWTGKKIEVALAKARKKG